MYDYSFGPPVADDATGQIMRYISIHIGITGRVIGITLGGNIVRLPSRHCAMTDVTLIESCHCLAGGPRDGAEREVGIDTRLGRFAQVELWRCRQFGSCGSAILKKSKPSHALTAGQRYPSMMPPRRNGVILGESYFEGKRRRVSSGGWPGFKFFCPKSSPNG